jgi:hypothetical protein
LQRTLRTRWRRWWWRSTLISSTTRVSTSPNRRRLICARSHILVRVPPLPSPMILSTTPSALKVRSATAPLPPTSLHTLTSTLHRPPPQHLRKIARPWVRLQKSQEKLKLVGLWLSRSEALAGKQSSTSNRRDTNRSRRIQTRGSWRHRARALAPGGWGEGITHSCPKYSSTISSSPRGGSWLPLMRAPTP